MGEAAGEKAGAPIRARRWQSFLMADSLARVEKRSRLAHDVFSRLW
jgi:hypothetical protein